MTPKAETYETSSLALATLLKMSEFEYELSQDDRGNGVFTFSLNGRRDELWEIVTDFDIGNCRVEPKVFMAKVRAVRNELYDFLGAR
jgi:hypothetical protein